jgi:sulfide:quinone oxidoreductase
MGNRTSTGLGTGGSSLPAISTRIVILGAGFGGLELSARLSEDVADDVSVTLIDQNDSFVFGYSKLDVVFGAARLDDVRCYYRDLAKPSVEFRQQTITSIDPVAKRVVTDHDTYDADVLVIALGADLVPAATPGLEEGGFEFYSLEGAERTHDALASFGGGDVVIGVLGPAFKCPPAASETALMLHDYLEGRGLREASTIHLLNPMPSPVPVSADTSAALLEAFAERGIEFTPQSLVTRLDPATKTAELRDGSSVSYDLFLAVPVHCAPPVVEAAGLTEDGWIPIDAATFATRFPDVYAVGDVTSAPVPRAGVFAEGEARTVADVLIATLRGGEPPAPYAGAASCYIDFGSLGVGRVDVDFLSGSVPTGTFSPPSAATSAEKEEFGASRRARWFS